MVLLVAVPVTFANHDQDKVSMGTMAARDARNIVELTRNVTAIHRLALAQAIDLRGVEW